MTCTKPQRLKLWLESNHNKNYCGRNNHLLKGIKVLVVGMCIMAWCTWQRTSWEEEEVPRLSWEDEPAGTAREAKKKTKKPLEARLRGQASLIIIHHIFFVVFSLLSDSILGSSKQIFSRQE